MIEYWVKALWAGSIAFGISYVIMLADADGEPIPPLPSTEYDKRLDRLDRKGIESAYVTRIGLLYTNAMTDMNESSMQRALKGHRNARKVYVDLMRGIDARDDENKADGFKLQSDTSAPFTLPAR